MAWAKAAAQSRESKTAEVGRGQLRSGDRPWIVSELQKES